MKDKRKFLQLLLAAGGAAIDEFEDWEWRFMLPGYSCGHYKVPPAPPGTPLPSVVVARADYSNS